MEPLIASYYRSLYFNNSETQEPLPESLRKMHTFAHRRCQFLGLRIGKSEVYATFLYWMSATGEGRKFATLHPDLAGLLGDPMDEADDSASKSVADKSEFVEGTPIVIEDGEVTETGLYVAAGKAGWASVLVNGAVKNVRQCKIRLATPAGV